MWAPDRDGCVWCSSPEDAHPTAFCGSCGGRGFVEGFDEQTEACPNERCEQGIVVAGSDLRRAA